jgi:hypothetical protein
VEDRWWVEKESNVEGEVESNEKKEINGRHWLG